MIYSKALDQTLEVKRIIGRIDGEKQGPCLIFFGGIHGNEPAGIFALHQVLKELEKSNIPIRGKIIALSGNIWALERSERYHEEDLNRLWTADQIKKLENGTLVPKNEDEKQQKELFSIIQNILSTENGPFYFFDLHTTSAETAPFLTVNDTLLNRKFTQQYPAPIVLGIDEYLKGPLLSYINELGYVSFGFESGQHEEVESVNIHIAFTYLSLVFSGVLEKQHIDYDHYYQELNKNGRDIYEIFFRYGIKENEHFEMEEGYLNFQPVNKGVILAKSNEKPVYSDYNSSIFMPLYQSKGNDGFFMIRKVHPVFLWLSGILRMLRFDRVLPYLPGISRDANMEDTLVVNLKIARVLTRQFLHILGYCLQEIDQLHIIVKNRETAARNNDYRGEIWK